MKIQHAVINVFILLSICSSVFANEDIEAQPGKRNILIIVADDMGIDLSRQYSALTGNSPASLAATPTLNKLQQSGIIFDNAWANPLSSPTRAGFLTGKHSFRTAITDVVPVGKDGLATAEITLPELISRAGYVSGLFGKWHLGGNAKQPMAQGFSTHKGILAGSLSSRPSRGYDKWRKYEGGIIVDGYLKTPRNRELVTTYATQANVQDAAYWISRQGKFARKWLAVVAFNAPHAPLHTPNARCDGVKSTAPDINRMIECMDTHIGWLLDKIDEHGELENTTVIFFADNGTTRNSLMQPFKDSPNASYKAHVFEGGIRVPYIISDGYHYKNAKPAPATSGLGYISNPGRRVNAMAHTLDVFATVVNITGVSNPRTFDSVSLLSVIAPSQTRPLSSRSEMYTDSCTDSLFQAAIRDNEYKLIYKVDYTAKARIENLSLYKVTDLAETTNLYDTPEDKNISASLLSKLKQLWGTEADRYEPLFRCPQKII